MTKRSYFFFNNEDALVFTAKVNSRREALRHYGVALVRTDIAEDEVAFLGRSFRKLDTEIKGLLAA
jgi:hypothetical protein